MCFEGIGGSRIGYVAVYCPGMDLRDFRFVNICYVRGFRRTWAESMEVRLVFLLYIHFFQIHDVSCACFRVTRDSLRSVIRG
jgi:hypothetical protein